MNPWERDWSTPDAPVAKPTEKPWEKDWATPTAPTATAKPWERQWDVPATGNQDEQNLPPTDNSNLTTAAGQAKSPPASPPAPQSVTSSPVPPAEPSSFVRRALGDPAVALAQGVVGLPEAVVGIANIPTLGLAGKAVRAAGVDFKTTKDYLDTLLSPETRAAQQTVGAAKGFGATIKAMVDNPSTIVQGGLESLPSMFAGGVIGRGALALAPRLGAIGAGALGEGLISAGQNAEQIRQDSQDGTLSLKQAALTAASGVATGVLSVLGGKLANRLGVEDFDTLMTAGMGEGGAKSVTQTVMKAVGGAVSEGLFEELPQSMSEQILQNIAQNKPWSDGVEQSAAMGAIVGGIMGAGANVLEAVAGGRGLAQPPPSDTTNTPAAPAPVQPNAPSVQSAPPSVQSLPPEAAPVVQHAAASPLPEAQGPEDAANLQELGAMATGRTNLTATETGGGVNAVSPPTVASPPASETPGASTRATIAQPPRSTAAADEIPYSFPPAAGGDRAKQPETANAPGAMTSPAVGRTAATPQGDAPKKPASQPVGTSLPASAAAAAAPQVEPARVPVTLETLTAGKRPVVPVSPAELSALPIIPRAPAAQPQGNTEGTKTPPELMSPDQWATDFEASSQTIIDKNSKQWLGGRVNQAIQIQAALRERRPVNAAALDKYAAAPTSAEWRVSLPSGYVREGNLYVFKPSSTDSSTAGAAAVPGVLTSPAAQPQPSPAPSSTPKQKSRVLSSARLTKLGDESAGLYKQLFTKAGKPRPFQNPAKLKRFRELEKIFKDHWAAVDAAAPQPAAAPVREVGSKFRAPQPGEQGYVNTRRTEAVDENLARWREMIRTSGIDTTMSAEDMGIGNTPGIRRVGGMPWDDALTRAFELGLISEQDLTEPSVIGRLMRGRNLSPQELAREEQKHWDALAEQADAEAKKLAAHFKARKQAGDLLRDGSDVNLRDDDGAWTIVRATPVMNGRVPGIAYDITNGAEVRNVPESDVTLAAGADSADALDYFNQLIEEQSNETITQGTGTNESAAPEAGPSAPTGGNADARPAQSLGGEPQRGTQAEPLTLSSETRDQRAAREQKAAQKAEILRKQNERLTGNAGDVGTGDMFDPTAGENALFTSPNALPQKSASEKSNSAIRSEFEAWAYGGQDKGFPNGREPNPRFATLSLWLSYHYPDVSSDRAWEIWNSQSDSTAAATFSEAAPRKPPKLEMNKPPPGGWTDADKVPSPVQLPAGTIAAEQFTPAAKNVVKLLTKGGLLDEINAAGSEYHKQIPNKPYIDLVIERHAVGPKGNPQLMLTHYVTQNGDAMIDSEMVFDILSNGQLRLMETAVRGPYGEVRGFDKSFAGMFSRNLLAQGFDKAALNLSKAAVPAAGTDRAPEFQRVEDAELRALINDGSSGLVRAAKMRKLATARGITLKQLQEAVELEVVRMAGEIVRDTRLSADAKFSELVKLYNRQPTLSARTSTSVENQAYSTPAPLAFALGHMALVDPATRAYDPTAGNGMLLIGAAPNSLANELNDVRAENLRKLGGVEVRQNDATKFVPEGKFDAVLTNPPFDKISNVNYDGFSITRLEHLIALRALEAMADNGTAGIITGARREMLPTAKGAQWIFENYLHQHFNVAGIFEVDGDLWARQGAKFPTRVVVIAGRKAAVDPAARGPAKVDRLKTWDDVWKRATEIRNEAERKRAGLDAGGNAGISVRVERPGAATANGGAVAGAASAAAATAGAASQSGRSGERQPSVARPAVAGGTERTGTAAAGQTGTPVRDVAAAGESAGRMAGVDRGGVVRTSDAVEDGAGRSGGAVARNVPRPADVKETEFQIPYQPTNDGVPFGTLIPKSIGPSAHAALRALEQNVGPLADYVAEKIGKSADHVRGVMAAEQIDGAALAIRNIETGGAAIIGDETGIGKGRQAAAVLLYAMKNGKVPVFFTKDPKLFTDMFNDLRDIGAEVRPMLLGDSVKASIVNEKNEVLVRATSGTKQKTELERIQSLGLAGAGYDMIFSTYSQIRDRNHRQLFFENLARENPLVMVMDESHEAAGNVDSSMQAAFFTGGSIVRGKGSERTTTDVPGLLNSTGTKQAGGGGVLYLSATYAKRPDNMPLYFRTLLSKAAQSFPEIVTAMTEGGVALQQAVSEALAKAGQYIRRERDFSSCNYTMEVVGGDRKAELAGEADEITGVLQDIVEFSRIAREMIAQESQGDTRGTAMSQSQIEMTDFGAIVHNQIGQMLLAAKADAVVEKALKAHRAGQKPVVALMNTMESFLEQYAKDKNVQPGDTITLGWPDLLEYALSRTLRASEKLGNGDTQIITYTPGQLGLGREYARILEAARNLKSSFPVSPIDYIVQKLAAQGVKMGELTGRGSGLLYTNFETHEAQYRRFPVAKKNQLVNDFNAGRTDALLLNASGSTGLSIHASTKFADQKPRHMIVAQPPLDINVFIQMLGRIKRTGMVEGGAQYSHIVLPLQAELRPAAMAAKKMKSLNANTTADADNAVKIEAPDIMNRYGDFIVAQYLDENPVLQATLDLAIDHDETGTVVAPEDLARRFTGRMALMPDAEQERAYAQIMPAYQELVEDLKSRGEYDLEITVHDDWAGRMKSDALLEQGADASNYLTSDIRSQEWDVKDTRHVPTYEEMRKDFTRNLKGADQLRTKWEKFQRDVERAFEKEIQRLQTENPKSDAAKTELSRKLDGVKSAQQRWEKTWRAFHQIYFDAGTVIELRNPATGELYDGMLTDLRLPDLARGLRVSPSQFRLKFMVDAPGGMIRLTLADFMGDTWQKGESEKGPDDLKGARKGQTFKRHLITGNPIRAYTITGGKGKMTRFRSADGQLITGILMPMSWKVGDLAEDPRLNLMTGAAAAHFVENNPMRIAIGATSIDRNRYGAGYFVETSSARSAGGSIFLDKRIRDITGDFTKYGSTMRARVDSKDLPAVAARIMEITGRKFRPDISDEARATVGPSVKISNEATRGARLAAGDALAPPQSADSLPRGEAERVAAVGDEVRALASRVRLPVETVYDFRSLPAADRIRLLEAADADGTDLDAARAAFLTGSRVVLFAKNLRSAEEAAATVFHEIFHAGFSSLPAAEVQALRDALVRGRMEAIPVVRAARERVQRNYAGLDLNSEAGQLALTNEVLAHVAENRTRMPGLWRRLVDAVRRLVARLVQGTALERRFASIDETMVDDLVTRALRAGARAMPAETPRGKARGFMPMRKAAAAFAAQNPAAGKTQAGGVQSLEKADAAKRFNELLELQKGISARLDAAKHPFEIKAAQSRYNTVDKELDVLAQKFGFRRSEPPTNPDIRFAAGDGKPKTMGDVLANNPDYQQALADQRAAEAARDAAAGPESVGRKSAIAKHLNGWGDVDVRAGVPNGLVLVPGGRREQAIAEAAGIEHALALSGFDALAPGESSDPSKEWKPVFSGIVIAANDAERMAQAQRDTPAGWNPPPKKMEQPFVSPAQQRALDNGTRVEAEADAAVAEAWREMNYEAEAEQADAFVSGRFNGDEFVPVDEKEDAYAQGYNAGARVRSEEDYQRGLTEGNRRAIEDVIDRTFAYKAKEAGAKYFVWAVNAGRQIEQYMAPVRAADGTETAWKDLPLSERVGIARAALREIFGPERADAIMRVTAAQGRGQSGNADVALEYARRFIEKRANRYYGKAFDRLLRFVKNNKLHPQFTEDWRDVSEGPGGAMPEYQARPWTKNREQYEAALALVMQSRAKQAEIAQARAERRATMDEAMAAEVKGAHRIIEGSDVATQANRGFFKKYGADLHATPQTRAETTFGGRKGVGYQVFYENLRQGEDAATSLARGLRDDFYSFLKSIGWKDQRIIDAKTKLEPMKFGGKPVKMTGAERIQLLWTLRDQDARAKLIKNGFMFQRQRGQPDLAIRGNATYMQLALDEFASTATADETKIVDKLLAHMKRLGDAANPASIELKGYAAFTSDAYAPIKTERSELQQNVELNARRQYDVALENLGFTRDRVTHGHPLLIGDVFDIYDDHSDQMARVAFLAVPIRDAMSALGDPVLSPILRKAMGSDFEKHTQRSLRKLAGLRDIRPQGGQFMARLSRGAASAVLSFRPTTILKNRYGGTMLAAGRIAQISTAMARAFVAKSMLPVMLTTPAGKRDMELLNSNGYLRDRWTKDLVRTFSASRELRESDSTALPSTWSLRWRNWQQKGLEPMRNAEVRNGIAMLRAFRAAGMSDAEAVDLVSQVTRETQNPSSALNESELYLNVRENPALSAMFPFVGEPVVSRNMIHSAIVGYLNAKTPAERRSARGSLAFATAGIIMNMAVSAGVTAVLYALKHRDEPDDEKAAKLTAIAQLSSLGDYLVPGFGGFVTESLRASLGYGMNPNSMIGGLFENVIRGTKRMADTDAYDETRLRGLLDAVEGSLTIAGVPGTGGAAQIARTALGPQLYSGQ